VDTPCRTDFKDENAMNTDEPTVAPLVATSSRQVSPPYRVAVDELIAQLGTSRARGLSQTEAQKRLRLHGPNELPAPRPVPEWVKFLRQFADPLIILCSLPRSSR
jgi:magnesium-transporting ATPase (P-type)